MAQADLSASSRISAIRARFIRSIRGRREIWDVPCYPDLAALPKPPDHAVVIVPAPAVQTVLETGVAAGLKSATVYSGFLGEGDDPEIVARGSALDRSDRAQRLVVSGPELHGPQFAARRLFGYPATELCARSDRHRRAGVTVGRHGAQHRPAGRRSRHQSSATRSPAATRSISISPITSTSFVDDEHIRSIALFIEGIRRPQAFMAAAARALAAGKPIVALKTGKSQKSREAAARIPARSPATIRSFAAMCERYGIVLCTRSTT